MTANQKKLDDGEITQEVLPVAQTGTPTHAIPFFQQDLIANVKHGYSDRVRGFTFGRRSGVENVEVDLWEGPTNAYVFPTTPQQMQLVVANAQDGASGTGVRLVSVHYLDGNYRQKTIDIIPSGNPASPTLTIPTDIYRINAMHASAVGSGGVAAGDISLTNLGGTVTYAIIKAGKNTCRQAVYTVPDGVIGYISHWQYSSGSTGSHFCQISMRATCHQTELYPGVFLVQDEHGSQNGGGTVNLPTPIPIPGRVDVKMSAIADQPSSAVIALGAIMGWFEPV